VTQVDRPNLLIIDDETEMGKYISLVGEENGFTATAIDDTENFESVYDRDISVIIVDMFMPGRDGVEILRFLAEDRFRGHIIIISGFDSSVLHSAMELATAHGLKILGALSKPILYNDIRNLLLKASDDFSADDPTLAGEIILPTRQDFIMGLERLEFEPYMQPQVDIKTGRLLGVEALVRWIHPTQGILTPDITIPMAENEGLMDELTYQLLEKTVNWLKVWKDAGLSLRASVNISASTIMDLSLPELVDSYLRAKKLPPGHLALEVTEQTLMGQLSTSLDILTRLRLKNIELSIDDFGTGHSSLIQLYRAPFSEIKIDRSFVSKATEQKEALAIVEMTIVLAHKLNMKTVAEGVEDAITMDLLKELGCDTAQGYYIARPMPPEELLDWEKTRSGKT